MASEASEAVDKVGNEYQGLPPPERNAVLHRLYDFIPPPLDLQDKVPDVPSSLPIEEQLIRLHGIAQFLKSRADSELKQALMVKLNALLSLANITQGFQEWILNHYDGIFDTGFFEKDPNKPAYPIWLAQKDPNDSGIFGDKLRIGREIELPAYKKAVALWMPIFVRNRKENKPLRSLGIQSPRMVQEGILIRWKADINAKYNLAF